jgi:hypothetical protein
MSKTVVAIANKSSQEIAPIAVKSGKKEVVSEEQVASWLEDAASGEYALFSVVPSDVRKKNQGVTMHQKMTEASFENVTLGVLSGLTGGLLSCAMFAIAVNIDPSSLPFSTFFEFLLGGASVLGTSSYAFHQFSKKRYRALWNKVMAVQSDGIHAWLDARYGIQVSDNVAEKLATQVLIETYIIRSEFQDMNGRFWVLRFDKSVKGFLVEPKPVEVKEVEAPARIRQAPVILSVGAGHLAGEAGKLGKHIDLRLAQLSRFALTVEESHGVARAVEDAREAVAGFERLELLGAGKNGLDRLTGILSLLDGELNAILQAKITEEDRALIARQQSVEARQKSKKVVGV